MARALTHDEARAFYDRFGRKQDLQRFYEDPAIDVLVRAGAFEDARAVVELGCGTGRLAERLLREKLPDRATYVGVDVSRTMIDLTRARLAPWSGRARAELVTGGGRLPVEDGACDRFVSTYVIDLMPDEEIRATLAEARRVLAPGGRLCLASLTFGRGLASRAVARGWRALHAIDPRIVGGCRPLRLADFVGDGWRVLHAEVVCTFAICTDVLVAAR